MNKDTLVTVLLTVYNRKTVTKTIDSVLNQTQKNFEFLIIDNASTDGTYELLLNYQKKDSRIYIHRNEKNMGQVYSLNVGLNLAKGQYIARIDADDIMLPNRLEKQILFLESNPDVVICGTWIQYISDDDKLTYKIKLPYSSEAINAALPFYCPFPHPSVMFRTEIIKRNNLHYDESFKIAADYDLWQNMLKYGKGYIIPKNLTYYRRGSSNDSKIHQDISVAETILVKNKIVTSLKDEPFFEELSRYCSFLTKEKKHFGVFYRYYRFFKKYISCFSLDKENKKLLNRQLFISLYGDFVIRNDAIWAQILKKMYILFRNLGYVILGRKSKA